MMRLANSSGAHSELKLHGITLLHKSLVEVLQNHILNKKTGGGGPGFKSENTAGPYFIDFSATRAAANGISASSSTGVRASFFAK